MPYQGRLAAVAERVGQGTDAEGVARDCRALVDELAQAGGLRRSPRTTPDMAQGGAPLPGRLRRLPRGPGERRDADCPSA